MSRKILMVCLGNICRSPLAHGILVMKIEQRNLDWKVDSAGTASYHQGELPDQRSILTARDNGIDITNQRSRQVTKNDFKDFDHILAMDASNFNNLVKLADTDSKKAKIEMILNYAYPNENRQVPDPYYDGGFEIVYEMLELACDKFLDAHT